MPNNFSRYQRIALFYDLLDLPFELVLYRRIRPLLFEGLSGRLLEVGVGTGRNFPFYPAGSHVVGVDISPAMLARAKRRVYHSAASIELHEMDAAALDFPDNLFDAAVGSFLFCVLDDTGQMPVLRELGRVVKPGGIIRLLNYVQPRSAIRRAIAKLWKPCAAWAFAASFDRHTEEAVTAAGLQFQDSRYVFSDLVKLLTARVAKL